jgi:1-acyl-sn-glycerol-3-phosphate acyltransferase
MAVKEKVNVDREPSSLLLKLPLISRFIGNVERNINKFGFQEGMRKVIEKSGSKLAVRGLTLEVERILKEKAVVVVSNHPNEAETLALIAALPKREDARLIVNFRFAHFCPSLEKYFIPVYVDHHIGGKHKRNIFGRLMKKANPVASLSPDEEHRRNIKSIRKASQVVINGGLIIIFPERRSKDGLWFSGVGHLLKGAKAKRKIYIVNAFNEGTSDWDYFRIIPGMGRFLPSVTLTFGKPKIVNHLLTKDPKEITKILEKQYEHEFRFKPHVILNEVLHCRTK